jgi:hypothetical protein
MAIIGHEYSLSELLSRLRSAVNDEGDDRWTQTEKETAIQRAVRLAQPEWWEERVDDTNTYEADTLRYDFPPACDFVLELWFGNPSGSSYARKFVTPTTWHAEGNHIVFTHKWNKYDGETLYIIYRVYVENLLDLSGDDLETTADSAIVESTGGSTFVSDGVQPGDRFEITEGDDEGTYYVLEVVDDDSVILHTEMTTTDATGLDFEVAYTVTLPQEYIIYKAQAELMRVAAFNRPGLEVDQAFTVAAYYDELAARVLNKMKRRKKGRRSY